MPEVVLRVAMSCGGCSGAVERIRLRTSPHEREEACWIEVGWGWVVEVGR